MYKTKADGIVDDTNQKLRNGVELEEALTEAISWHCRYLSEDAQADVFVAVRPCFDEFPHGTTRRIAVAHALKTNNIQFTYGAQE